MTGAAPTTRDKEEWIRLLRGEGPEATAAQEELRQLIAGALRKATSKNGALDDATLEDLTQISFLKVLSKLERFEGRSRFTTWAYSVAVRAAFAELRKAQYRTQTTSPDEHAETLVDDASPATEGIERQEIVDVLYRVIEQDLTERQRVAILGELRGRSSDELVEELGTNKNALYKLQHDARVKLRSALEDAGISDQEVRETFDL